MISSIQLLILLLTSAVFTAAMPCNKMILENSSNENMAATNDVMEMGQYIVRTTRRTDSAEIREMISTLDGASDVQYKRNSFTAVLEPKDLKKLCHNNSHLVRTIKEVKKMNKPQSCNKLRKGDPKFVIPSSYIVMIKPNYEPNEMTPLVMAASNDLDNSVMISSVREIRNPNRRGATMRMNSAAVEFLCNQSIVDYIEEDQKITVSSSTSQWHLDRIDQRSLPLDEQYTSPNNGSGVDIYVFDTGINLDHNEFEGRAMFDSYDPVDIYTGTKLQGMDCNGHGTHVAALIAGKTYGVAKGATVYSMRVFGCSGEGSFVNVLLGLNHVMQQTDDKINDKKRRIIINMSLRGPFSQAVDDTVRDATDQGILVVAAAGNDYRDACRYSPGASSYALTVGGTNQRDKLYVLFGLFGTNYGRCVDIFAPGEGIQSAGLGSNGAVAYMSGTSQAAPLVSGAAAVYWNMNRDATPLEIKDKIISTCTHDKLDISAEILADQTPNCLLFIDNQVTTTHVHMSAGNSSYQIFHSVPSSMVETYIKNQEKNSYALAYIDSYSTNSLTQYNLIFKYMADIEFVTIMSPRLGKIQRSVASYEEDGYQLTLIYSMMGSIDYIAVLEKTNLPHSHEYRLTEKEHETLYQTKSSQGESLLSTTVALTAKEKFKYTSIYVHDNIETHHLSSVSVSELLTALDEQLNQGFYLTHLTTIPTNPPRYAVVFHKMTKPTTNYVMSKDLELNKVNEFVEMQISEGFNPLVVAALDTPNGLKFVVSFEL